MSAETPLSSLTAPTTRLVKSGWRWDVRVARQAAILGLVFAAFCLRLYGLDNQALRGDEAATVHYSALPITKLWELSRVTDPHPPLYYLLLHPWQWGLGESAWAMRFPGVLASVLVIAALYSLARRTLGATQAGLLAAGLLALNPLQVWLAQDIRAYALFTLLGLLSAGALWQALCGSAAARDQPAPVELNEVSRLTFHLSFPWLLYVLFTVACFYTHYYTVFLIAFEGLFVLANLKQFWAKKWPWLASQLVIGLAILPGLLLAYNFRDQAGGGIDTLPVPAILRLASTALLTGFTLDDRWGLAVSLLLAPVWLIGLAALLRGNFLSGTFWALFFAGPVLGVIGLSIGRPIFKERFLVQAQPAFELLLAAGLLTLARYGRHRTNEPAPGANGLTDNQAKLLFPLNASRWPLYALRLTSVLFLAGLVAVNLLALRNYLTDPAYAKATPWNYYGDYVSDHARPGDVVLTNFPEAAVSYYSPNTLPFEVVPIERDLSAADRVAGTAEVAGRYRRIWFLPLLHQGFDEHGDVLNWLDRHADRVDQIFFPTYNLNLYLAPPALEQALIAQPATFSPGIRLRGYQILDQAGDSRLVPALETGSEDEAGAVLILKPGDEFTLSLYWLAAGPTDVPYTVFTHLVAADGFVRTGRDNEPVWGTYPTTGWQPGEKITDKYTLTLPAGSPPGDHWLEVGWYRADTQTRVPTLDEHGQPAGDRVRLNGVIRVE